MDNHAKIIHKPVAAEVTNVAKRGQQEQVAGVRELQKARATPSDLGPG